MLVAHHLRARVCMCMKVPQREMPLQALAAGVWSTAYHEAADRRSTLAMLSLFAEIWPQYTQNPVTTNACGTVLGQAIVTRAKL